MAEGPIKRPDRSEYPDPDPSDFVEALRRAADGEEYRHHVAGRYTAYRAYRDIEDAGLPPETAKEPVVVVEACERDTITVVPIDHVEQLVAAVQAGGLDG